MFQHLASCTHAVTGVRGNEVWRVTYVTLGPFLTLRVATRLDHIFTSLRDS